MNVSTQCIEMAKYYPSEDDRKKALAKVLRKYFPNSNLIVSKRGESLCDIVIDEQIYIELKNEVRTNSLYPNTFKHPFPTALEKVFGNADLISWETILKLRLADENWVVRSSCKSRNFIFLASGPSEDADR